MIGLRATIVFFISSAVTVSAGGANDLSSILRAHPVWIQDGLSWEPDPGAKGQTWAGGEILYFGVDGTFGRFGGIIFRRGKTQAISATEGEIVHAGRWAIKDSLVSINYRLVGMYKVLRPNGEKLPEIPGPTKQSEIRLDPNASAHLEFESRKYGIASGFNTSELQERLRSYGLIDADKVAVSN